ncbi:GNAT family N-acetyltransferase [Bacillus sp. RAR_GA_16]|uniref:GNAT family N-acetyltransferase n=1 Tax=Bacillus sp. RAR_GA_16 TaxID=2876774 RepID=UPI001CC9FBAE|nr:GNAT family protein [Bacillus sp. RAR_GA_16]MCA0173371.1 GNAT family N-acetyltransferase [Bacillus sp. RAR_GA_16]
MKDFPTIETNRLILTSLKEEDQRSLFSIFSDPNVTYYDGGKVMKTQTQALHYIRAYKDPSSILLTHTIRFGIRLKKSGDLIGTAGFQNWDRTSSKAEIGAILSRKYWSGGYGLEAAKAIIEFGFQQINLHKIYAQTIEDNRAAVNRLEQLGFHKEGHFKDHIYMHSHYYDVVVYSLINK